MSTNVRTGVAVPSSSPDRTGPGERGRSDLALVILLGVLWGTAFPVIRAGIVAGAPPLLFAAVRYVLTASAPLASALFGYRLLPGERFGRWGLAGLLVGFVGVGILVLPQFGTPSSSGFEGPTLVVAAVIAFALGSVLLRRTSHATPGLWTLSVQFAVAGGLVETLALLTREPMSLGSGATVFPALGFLVVFPGILGYSLYFYIHHSSGPARANVVGYVNPATGLLVGLLVFGEIVTGVEIGGLILIAAGLFLLQRERSRTTVRSSGVASPTAATASRKH